MKFLKTLWKIFITTVLIFVALGVLIVIVRKYNDNKYRPKDWESLIYVNPTDITKYKTDLDGVEIEHIKGDYLNGFHLKPKEKLHKGCVVFFGGSEGSPSFEIAEQVVGQGYEVLSLFFFGMDNQREKLSLVPLEFFEEVLEYINVEIGEGPLTVYGVSKGAELALNLSTIYPEIDNIILMAPSAWNFMGLDYASRDSLSSWTYKGKELPFGDMRKSGVKESLEMFGAMILNRPVAFRPIYETIVANDENSEEIRIKVENSKANILIFSAGDDMVWQSDVAAKEIYDHRPNNTEVHNYPEAGHVFIGDKFVYSEGFIMASGGNIEVNNKAGLESMEIIKEKLGEWHK